MLRERLEREGEPLPEDLENLDNLSPEEKKAMDAERRAAWRKARLKSLENVCTYLKLKLTSCLSYLLPIFLNAFIDTFK